MRKCRCAGPLLVLGALLAAGCSQQDSQDAPSCKPVNFGTIAQIVRTNCTVGGCHGRTCAPQGMALDTARMQSSTVMVRSTEDPGRFRIEPGHPERSYLMAKIEGTDLAPGTSRMPPGSLALTDEELAQFRCWIAQGASFKVDPAATGPAVQCNPDTAQPPTLPAPSPGMQLVLPTTPVGRGQDVSLCVVRNLTGDKPMFLRGFRSEVSKGSHHVGVLIRKGNLPETKAGESANCLDLHVMDGAPVYAAQTRSAELLLPDGYAMQVEPHSQIIFWNHFDNASACPLKVSASLNVLTAAAADVKQQVSVFNVEDFKIQVPLMPEAPPSVACDPGKWYSNAVSCLLPPDVPGADILALVSHTHASGRRVEVSLFDSQSQTVTKPIYVSDDWQNPLFGYFWPKPLHLEPGQGLNIRCSYYYECSEHKALTPAVDCPQVLEFNGVAEKEMCSVKAWYASPKPRDIDSGECAAAFGG